MARPKVFIDGFLLNWGDSLFYPPVRRIKNNSPKLSGWAIALIPNKATEIRAQIKRTARKAPEVMVKITSKLNAGKGMIAIGKHLDYISRNGKIELEDQEGRVLNGRADVSDIKDDWGDNIPEVSKRRESINVIFSMAKGAPADEVKNAVREYLKEEFGGKHEYVFALHTDTDNPHVHVCIKMAPIHKKNKRLNPRKNDLQRWREGFAVHLRKLGIDANATPRKTRGVTQQTLHQYQVHQSARNKSPVPRRAAMPSIQNHTKEINAWANIAHALASSEDRDDRALAKDVVDFVASQPIQQQSNHQDSQKDQSVSTEIVGSLSPTFNNLEIKNEQSKITTYRAAIYQSNFKNNEQSAAAKSINSVRNVSSLRMVQNERSSEMLLLKNAPHHMGAGRTTDTSVRRARTGDSGVNDGSVQIKTPRT
jgi:hypothetical protein